jgi:hypothetical protein
MSVASFEGVPLPDILFLKSLFKSLYAAYKFWVGPFAALERLQDCHLLR